MKIKVDGFLMYGDYTDKQINLIFNEMKKPKNKRLYLMGIEFSQIDNIEVLKGGLK